jgi:hypothetical protein
MDRMKNRIWIWIALIGQGFGLLGSGAPASAADHTVYEVYRAIDLGETDRQPPKEIFVDIGSLHGVKKGSVLDVYRKISSFNNLTEKFASDHVVPVGKLRVIHADEKTAIARIERFVSPEQELALLPQAILIGDLVRLAN